MGVFDWDEERCFTRLLSHQLDSRREKVSSESLFKKCQWICMGWWFDCCYDLSAFHFLVCKNILDDGDDERYSLSLASPASVMWPEQIYELINSTQICFSFLWQFFSPPTALLSCYTDGRFCWNFAAHYIFCILLRKHWSAQLLQSICSIVHTLHKNGIFGRICQMFADGQQRQLKLWKVICWWGQRSRVTDWFWVGV